MNSNLGTYLRTLAALAISLGAVSTSHAATNGGALNADKSMKRMEQFAVSADAQGIGSPQTPSFIPWYYQAWPESTWRQFVNPHERPAGPGNAGSEGESFTDILNSVC